MNTYPAALEALPQWVCWCYQERDGKATKAPIDAKSNGNLTYAKSNDPSTWTDLETALSAWSQHPELSGVGFCFAPNDGLTGLDLDHVIDPETGELKPEAAEILEQFKDTYAEVSPSGTGLRLFCYGRPQRSGKNVGRVKWLEVYSHPSSRYLTVTGNHWNGTAKPVTGQQAALDWLHERFMQSTEGTDKPVGSRPGAISLDDAQLLAKASKAKNGAEFDQLWRGDTSGHGSDDSAADLALCNLLAFWTDHDAAHMDRLFRQSGLMRPKWNTKRGESTYGQMTIDKALASVREGYQNREQAEPTIEAENETSRQRGADSLDQVVETDQSRITYRRASAVTVKPIRWLWRGRIARGKLTILAGNPGLGKSQLTTSLAAICSIGGRWPVDRTHCEHGNVVIVSAEDDPEDTITPRLMAADADLDRVYIIDVVEGCRHNGDDGKRALNLKIDIARLDALLTEIGGAALLIIDPITAYLGDTDSHKNAEIRALLAPLADLAAKHNTAVVGVSHLNKSGGAEALMRVMGSLAFVAAARAAYVVVKDQENEARRLFLPLKNNIGDDRNGLAFTVRGATVDSPQGPIETSHIVWEDDVLTISADETMSRPVDDDRRSERQEAAEWLRETLIHGRMASDDILKLGRREGFTTITLRRAKEEAGVVVKKDGFKDGKWYWRLKDHHEDVHEGNQEGDHPPKSDHLPENIGDKPALAVDSIEDDQVFNCDHLGDHLPDHLQREEGIID